jgi:SAM-dependent methyltransferase
VSEMPTNAGSTSNVEGAVDRWSAGLDEETEFWFRWLRDHGEPWPDVYRQRTNSRSPLQPHIRRHVRALPGSRVRILDVGSGPVTALGKRWSLRRVRIIAVDPLADRYAELYERTGFEPLVRPIRGEAEHLAGMFPADSFDLVYAQNCIDHGYDPLRSIRQMLTVVRRGHTVLLEHAIDEGEFMKYAGPHQWNFRAEDDRLVIWRPGLRVDAHAELEPLADLELDSRQDIRWLTVALRKH